MLEKMKITTMDLSDVKALEEVDRFCEEGGLPRTDWMKSEMLNVFIMRDSDGRLSATVRLEKNGERAFIEDLVVREDLRGKGLGEAIIGELIKDARRRKIRTVWTMARAHGFFKKIGFIDENDKELLERILQYCKGCEDYKTKCNPQLLRKDI